MKDLWVLLHIFGVYPKSSRKSLKGFKQRQMCSEPHCKTNKQTKNTTLAPVGKWTGKGQRRGDRKADQDGGGEHMERFQGAMLGILRKQNFVTEYEGGEGVKVNLQVTNLHNWRKGGVPFTELRNPGERCPL